MVDLQCRADHFRVVTGSGFIANDLAWLRMHTRPEDGPVEIRETHKKGGYTVGVASNEIRRYGLNFAKRTRLIEAGADLIIPDYCQMDQLLEVLTGG